MLPVKLYTAFLQHQGRRREQQDSLKLWDSKSSEGGILAILTDGMGGMRYGREASTTAIEAFQAAYRDKAAQEGVELALERSLHRANEAVLQAAAARGSQVSSGTTLVAAVITDDSLHWISVGDSRLYLWRNGRLTQVTADHVYGAQLDDQMAQGEISQEAAQAHPQRASLTSYLGSSYLAEIDQSFRPFRLRPGDRVFLCSDGVYACLGEADIAAALRGDPVLACQLLIEKILAQENDDQDNMSVIVIGCEPELQPAPPHLPESSPSATIIFVCLAALAAAGGWLAGQSLRIEPASPRLPLRAVESR